MPVNHKLKVIFIHIPKTAGTSVEYAFGMHGRLSNIGIERYLKQKKDYDYLFGDGLQHLSAKQVKRFLGGRIYSEYFKFSIVRNPYDRLVSFIGSRNGMWERKEKLSKEHFINYLNQSQNIFSSGTTPLPKLQINYIRIRKKLAVDFILHYEKLDEEFKSINSLLNTEIKLDHRMKSYHDDYKSYYDDHSMKLVKKIYKKDFEFLGYDANRI